MMENYDNLCTFNFGKRSYVIMKNSIKVMYFENNDDKYQMPIVSFNLYDNMGKSLTVVNQHFFMSQLVNRLNVAYKKGIFNDDELVSFLSDMKSNIEKDAYLKKLFKGSFMNEIDEANFEKNKKEILKYLDSFKFDTFVNYNNVSIFTGSLEKEENVPAPDDSVVEESDGEIETDAEESLESDTVQEQDENVVSESNDELDDFDELLAQNASDTLITDDYGVDSSSETAVSSSDYFGSNADESSIQSPLNGEQNVDTTETSPDEVNSSTDVEVPVSESFEVSENVESVSTSSNVESTSVPEKTESAPVSENNKDASAPLSVENSSSETVENYMWSGEVSSSDSNNISYVSDVASRIQNSEPEVSSESVVNESKQEMIQAVPELDEIVNTVQDDSDVVETGSKKGRIFLIIFLIIFILVLIGISYYLYNNVF